MAIDFGYNPGKFKCLLIFQNLNFFKILVKINCVIIKNLNENEINDFVALTVNNFY